MLLHGCELGTSCMLDEQIFTTLAYGWLVKKKLTPNEQINEITWPWSMTQNAGKEKCAQTSSYVEK